MNYELLYTSAPQGLKQGSRGFCTVLSTAGIPLNLTQKLESISGYRHLYQPGDERADANPVCYSHLQFPLAGRIVSVISRIAAYGFDYSQRSNKIAHHIAIEGTPPQCGPAALLHESSTMRTGWDQQCRSLPKGPELPDLDLNPQVCQRWQEMTGDAGWAGSVVANWLSPSAKPMWIVFSEDQSAALLELMLEATALLPPEHRWRATFSTYCTNLAPDVDCRVRCVLAGSEEARLAKSRGMVVDLTKPMPSASDSPESQAARAGVTIDSQEDASSMATIDLLDANDDAATPDSAGDVTEPTELAVKETPPAITSVRSPSIPPSIETRALRTRATTNRWITPTLLSICLILAVAVAYLATRVMNPYPDALIEELRSRDAETKSHELTASAVGSNSVSAADAHVKDNYPPVADAVETPTPKAEPVNTPSSTEAEKPELVFHAIGETADLNITRATFSEAQMRGKLELAKVELKCSGVSPNDDDIRVETEPESSVTYEDGLLVWNGKPDFRMKALNDAVPITVDFVQGDETITKVLSVDVTNTPDPDIELSLRPDNPLLSASLVAGIRLDAFATTDLDEFDSSKRDWVWERAEYSSDDSNKKSNAANKAADLIDGSQDESRDAPKGSEKSDEQLEWTPITNERGNSYVVRIDDYGYRLRCKLVYRELADSPKTVNSNEMQCLSPAVLSYEFADLVNMPTNRIKGTVRMDLAALNVPNANKASWRLNGNKVIVNEGRMEFAFDLGSVMSSITEPIKTWSLNITEAKDALRANIGRLHSLYKNRLESASIPLDSDMGRAYLMSATKNHDTIDFIDQFEGLGEFEKTVERFLSMHLDRDIAGFDYIQLKAGLVDSNNLYPHRNEKAANDATAQAERMAILLSYSRIGTKPSDQNQNSDVTVLRSDTQSKIANLKRMLREPVRLEKNGEPPKISITKALEEGSLEKPKELISFPIALKLQINPDKRYSRFVAEQ